MPKKIMKSGHNAGEDEESGHDGSEDREIRARCRRTRNKMKGSNPSTMPKNPKQNEVIKPRNDVEKLETKQRDRIRVRYRSTRNKMKG